MKQLREITRPHKQQTRNPDNPINADCRLLELRSDMTDDEKWDLIEQFARKVVAIKRYDVFLFAVW